MIRAAAAWTSECEAFIALALASASLDDIKRQTECGAMLFELVADGGAVVGAFVLRVDREACRNVGVVVAAGGGVSGVDLTALIMPTIERMFYGCESIRIHTARPGLLKKLAPQGYKTAEIIFEKSLKNG